MKIGIIGCGNMGQAILKGLINRRYASRRDIFCSDQNKVKLRSVCRRFGTKSSSSNNELVRACRVVILAIKPQDLRKLAKQIGHFSGIKLIISVCAGVSTQVLERYFGKVAVVRAMPNMPARVSFGISAITKGKYAKAKDKKLAKNIFSCIGDVVEVRENLLDAVTAISGSGPAYFFYLIENLINAAKKMGLAAKVARKLAITTALGSALLLLESEESPSALRKRVSSRGGTTEAAFEVFKKAKLSEVLCSGFYAAAKRAKKLRK